MEKRLGITIESKRNPDSQKTKWPFQLQSYWYHDLHNPMIDTIYGQFDFEQFLVDSEGQYWFTEKTFSDKETTEIFVFNASGELIKNMVVKGKPTLYEFEHYVVVACEGWDDQSHIYRYCKKQLILEQHWTVEGFLWDLDCNDESLFITCYLSDINEAVLYIIDINRKKALDLGAGVFPSGILYRSGYLYISFSYIQSGKKGKMVKLDLEGNILGEMDLDIAPRQIFSQDDHIILHGLNMANGAADQLVYFDIENETQQSYKIPKSSDIRPQEKHMLLHIRDSQSIIYWSHEKRKIVRVAHLPVPNKEMLERTHWSL
ncbi:MAG: hypothetical protein ACO1OC_02710 [Tuberibacillus sp.]